MKVRLVTRTLISVAVAAAVSGTAIAEEVVDKGVTLSIGGAYNDYDSQRGIDNALAPQLGLGYRFNDRYSLEAVYSEKKTDLKNSSNDVRVKNYRLDGFYDLSPWSDGLTPYIVAGIGEIDEAVQHGKDRDDTRVNGGIGLRTALSPYLSLRGDVRAVRSLDYHQTESMLNVALTWTFGTPGKPAQQPAPAPAPAPAPEPVKQPLDSDNDGVIDSKDQCPDTAPGVVVNELGCAPAEKIDLQVEFDFDSAVIRSEAVSRIAAMGDFLKRHQDVRIRLEGHTDSTGPAAYNKRLSQKRVDSVRQMLISDYGIDGSRIDAVGFGEEQPLADNGTREGRQDNRRVIAVIL
ncbi:OmpA family protein [Spongorhabdus nitratireducens]